MLYHFYCEVPVNFVQGIKFLMPVNYEVYFKKPKSHSIFTNTCVLEVGLPRFYSRFSETLLYLQLKPEESDSEIIQSVLHHMC
jgi:hypothetical protein